MFYHVRGKLIHVEEGMAAVECAGVAFALKTTNNTLSKLPALQSEVTLYTYFLVREGAMELYGFYDQGERNCFQMLLTVSGVGPKAALAILSHLSRKNLPFAWRQGMSNPLPGPRGRAETGPETDSGAQGQSAEGANRQRGGDGRRPGTGGPRRRQCSGGHQRFGGAGIYPVGGSVCNGEAGSIAAGGGIDPAGAQSDCNREIKTACRRRKAGKHGRRNGF